MHSLKVRQLLSSALVTAVIGSGVTAEAAEVTPFKDTMSRDTTSVAGSQETISRCVFSDFDAQRRKSANSNTGINRQRRDRNREQERTREQSSGHRCR